MKEQIAIQNLLRSGLLEIQSKNYRYSLRSYADKVGVHVGTLSAVLNGKRNVSRGLAEKIARKLLIDPQQRTELLDLFPQKIRTANSNESQLSKTRYLELEASQFKMISEWEHYAILSLMNCKDFDSSYSWMATRLGLTEVRTKEVIERLIEVGIVRRTENGTLARDKSPYRSSDDTVNLSLRKSHDITMDLAKESLHHDDIHERDFTHLTMSIDPKKIVQAKEMIRQFQDDLSSVMETGEQTEVYRFSTQLFPLTKLKN